MALISNIPAVLACQDKGAKRSHGCVFSQTCMQVGAHQVLEAQILPHTQVHASLRERGRSCGRCVNAHQGWGALTQASILTAYGVRIAELQG